MDCICGFIRAVCGNHGDFCKIKILQDGDFEKQRFGGEVKNERKSIYFRGRYKHLRAD